MHRMKLLLCLAGLLIPFRLTAADPPRSASVDPSAASTADSVPAVQLLPAHCLAVAELPRPVRLLDTLLDHPVWKRFQELDEYQQAIQEPKSLFFQAAVGHVEDQIGISWREAVAVLAEGGVTLAFDPREQGAILLVRGRDEASVRKLTDSLLKIARTEAERNGRPDAIPETDYRGVTVYGQSGGRFAVVGPWLIASSRDSLGRAVVDRLLDGPRDGDSLLSNDRFRTARDRRDRDVDLWVWGDLAALRESGPGAELKKGQADNPAAELLVGGLLSNLRQTPWATASLSVSAERTRLALTTPHDPGWVEESREYFFGPGGRGAAPPLLKTPGTIFGLATYRNISAMWLRAGDLFNEQTLDEMAKAEANLSTLFSGKDFGEEILGTLNPALQLIVARQDFTGRRPQPAIRLPAFALVAELSRPEETWPELRRTFQSLVGFLNVVGAMQGNPQLDLATESYDGRELVRTAFAPEAREKDSTQARLQFNFSPSVGLAGDRFVLSSTTELARNLLTAHPASPQESKDAEPRAETSAAATGQTPGSAGQARVINTAVYLNPAALRDALEDNRGQLVAQNMLKEGRSREEAERQFDLLFAALRQFRDLSLTLSTGSSQLQLELVVDTVAAGEAAARSEEATAPSPQP